MNRPVNLFWSESSHYFGANSPVRNFERNVPEESSREELVLERTVPEPDLPSLRVHTLIQTLEDNKMTFCAQIPWARLYNRMLWMCIRIASTTYEPRREKTGFLHICENKDADQLRGNRKADQRLCFRYIDSTIPLLHKSEISSL